MKAMICLILDRSGSMNGRETDVIGGVNKFLSEQKALPDPASIAFVRFDSEATETFRPMAPLAECSPLTASEYQPRGGTPLLDAVGKTISQLDDDWKREQPDRAIVVIVTDGQENASREYTKDKVRALIESRQASGQWSFIYLGANVDSFAEAGAMGIHAMNTANYQNTAAGTKAVYDSMSLSVSTMRATGATLAANLGGDIGEDGSLKKKPAASVAAQAWSPPASSLTTGAWTAPK